jgi:hypothetical protein
MFLSLLRLPHALTLHHAAHVAGAPGICVSAHNNIVPKFWIPIYAFREGSSTGTNAGQLLNKKPFRNMTEMMLVEGGINY